MFYISLIYECYTVLHIGQIEDQVNKHKRTYYYFSNDKKKCISKCDKCIINILY